MADLGKAYVQIVPSAEGISGAIQSVLSPEASSAGQSAGQSIGKQLGSFAVKTVAALGVGKAIGDSFSNGMNFESSMAKTHTLFSGTSEEFAALQDQILGISSATGVAASQLAEAAYSAESASVPMGNLGGMIESSAKLATAGFTDVDTALSATAKTMNAYGMMSDDVAQTQANMDKVQKVLIQTQNKGITTVGELGASLAQVTPTAAAANVSFEQVGAALALMTAQGTPTAQATTQLRSAIAELEKSGTKASDALVEAAKGTEYAGMSFTEMMENGANLGDVMGMLQDYADASGVSMLDLWSSIEGGNAALAIAKDVGTFNEDLEAMSTNADVVGEAYGTMSDTVSFKMEQIKTSLQNMGIEAFSAVADKLSGALSTISSVFSELQGPLGELGSAFLEMGGAAVNAVADLLGIEEGSTTTETAVAVLKEVIGGLTDGMKFLSENMDTVIPIVGTLAGALLVMHSPIPQIVSGVGGLVEKFSSLGSASSAVAGPAATAGASFGTMAGEALKLIAAAAALVLTAVAIQMLVDAAIQIASAGLSAQITLAAMAVGIAGLMAVAAALGPELTAGAVGIGVFGAAMVGIGAGIDLACDGISRVLDAVGRLTQTVSSNADGINSVVSNMGSTVSGVIDSISDGISKVVDSIGSAISGVLDSIAGIIESIGNAALNAGEGFEKLANAVMNLTNNTGVFDLAGTLGAVADGVKKINNAAGESSSAASKVTQLTTAMRNVKPAVDNTKTAFSTFSQSVVTAFNNVMNGFRSMNLGVAVQNEMNMVTASIQTVVNAFNTMNLGAIMSNQMSSAIYAASSGISTLQSMFANTTFRFNQSIALPHFSMSGTFDAESGTVPSVSVSWYKKAAEYGALFASPQIIGVGDAAQPELLIGEHKLQELLGGKGKGDITINLNYEASDDATEMLRDIARGVKRYRMAGVF